MSENREGGRGGGEEGETNEHAETARQGVGGGGGGEGLPFQPIYHANAFINRIKTLIVKLQSKRKKNPD